MSLLAESKVAADSGIRDSIVWKKSKTKRYKRNEVIVFLLFVTVLSLYSAVSATRNLGQSNRHQIDLLIENAQAEWLEKQQTGQDQSFAETIQAYRKRYGREPPAGFDAWFTFAKANGVANLNNYDAIMEDLAPFRPLPGKLIEQRAKSLIPNLQANDSMPHVISVVQILQHNITVIHENGIDLEWDRRGEVFADMLREVNYNFSDMWFPVNEDAPPRVLVSHKALQEMLPSSDEEQTAEFVTHSAGTLFEEIKRSCPPDSALNLGGFPSEDELHELDFIRNHDHDLDICSHPELPKYHSAFRQRWWTTINSLVPLFSYSTTTVHRDIRIPASMYYFSDKSLPTQSKYEFSPARDVLWEKKHDALFWRGRTTDGVADDLDFEAQQRHRLVNYGHEARGERAITSITESGSLVQRLVKKFDLNKSLMNVWFSRPMTGKRTCTDEGDAICLAAKNNHPFLNAWSDHHEAWSYKYLADLDGYGYSAKFRGLLASTSVPIKSTVYKEFFSDLLVPWVHYVPMSNSMSELYNILVYFTGGSTFAPEFKGHDEEARRIAEAGSRWVQTHLRREDMVAYVFRLALEYARLCADESVSMDFVQA